MAGLIPPEKLEQIRAASDIVEIIGGYLPLKRAGINFTTLCPFHKEKSPSFNVNPQKQIFHCFGCHKGGNVFTFVKEFENIPFIDAVRRLAERAKIPLEFENLPGQQQARQVKDTLLQIHDQIARRWETALANDAAGQIARDYLAKRGVPAEAVKLFRLGYAPDLWDDTVNWAKSKGYELPVVEQAGLIIRKEGADHFYDRFRGRLIFPICDEQGRVVGFSGRVLSGDEKTAKYVNSPETPIFTKGRVFYGLDKSKRAMADAEFAVVCEGQLDLIACYMAGVQNIVAPQGTAFTPDHARILKRYVDEVVLCFDSDVAGQSAAVRVFDSLLASELSVRVAVVPAPHDPDSFIKEFGGPAFQELIKKAEGFFDYYLNRLCETNDFKTDKGRLTILKAMAEAVQKKNNSVIFDTYAQKTAMRLGVSAEAVRAEFKKAGRSKPVAPAERNEAKAEPDPPVAKPSNHEWQLIRLLLRHDELAAWACRYLAPEWLEHPFVRQIVEQRLRAEIEQTWNGVATLIGDLDNDQARSLATEALAEDRPIPLPEQQIMDVSLRLRNQFIDRQMAALELDRGQPGLSEEESDELLRAQQARRLLKRTPLEPLEF